MTTTAHEDQYTVAPEPVRQPYDTVSILKQNVADLELALRTQTERAEAAEAEMTKARKQKPIKYLYRVTDCFGHDVLRDDPKGATILETIPLFAAPVPAPAVPYGIDAEAANRIALAVYDWINRINPEPLLYAINRILATEAHPLSVEGRDALLQSAPQAPAVPELDPMTRLIVSDPKQPKPTALQAPAVPVYLLERQENGLSWYIGATTCFGGAWHWTADVNSAIRFSREEDAAACWNIIARHHVGIGGSGTTETTPEQHIFEDVRSLLQSAEVRHD